MPGPLRTVNGISRRPVTRSPSIVSKRSRCVPSGSDVVSSFTRPELPESSATGFVPSST
jgi:hypothetical protein